MEIKVTEKKRLEIREDNRTTPIEVTTTSSDAADEEQIFFAQADSQNELEKQTLERKEQSYNNAMQWVANSESLSLKTNMKDITTIDEKTTSCSMKTFKSKARIRVKQNVQMVLKNVKLKNLGQPHDEMLITTYSRYKPYKAHEDRMILKDGLQFRK